MTHWVRRRLGEEAHPLYDLWHDLKPKLCKDWQEDFMSFAEWVGDRPVDHVLLLKAPNLGLVRYNVYWGNKKCQALYRCRRYKEAYEASGGEM